MNDAVEQICILEFDLRQALDTAGDSVFLIDPAGRIGATAGGGHRRLGLASEDEARGRAFLDLWSCGSRSAVMEGLVAAACGQTADVEVAAGLPDGSGIWAVSLRRHKPQSDGLLFATAREVTATRSALAALEKRNRLHQALIEVVSEMTWHLDVRAGACFRQGWREFTGVDLDHREVHDWIAWVHADDRPGVVSDIQAAVSERRPFRTEYRLHHRDGEWRTVEDYAIPLLDGDGQVTDWVGIITDIHDRRVAEARIWRAAHIDDLTGLANRVRFQDCVDSALAEAERSGHEVGLVLVDIDRFKEINDSFGHAIGDGTLRSVAARLTESVPCHATVARLGSDEFGILLPAGSAEEIGAVADTVLHNLQRGFDVANVRIELTAKAGCACFPSHDADPAALFANASIALHAAKTMGGARIVAFARSMRAELDRRVAVLRNARDALAADTLLPYYQPKISLATGAVIGFEALLRWREGDVIRPPAAIAEAFADFDLGGRIGSIMLDKVIEDMRAWSRSGLRFGHVALNVGSVELHQPAFVETVLGRLDAAALSPGHLEIEVTESVLIESGTRTVTSVLDALHAAGIAIALDDFGTGFASLTHLKMHPVSWLKIDRSFVSNLETEPDSATIVQAVIGMARNLGLKVVAEGVETAWQRTFLRRIGCDAVQGYLIARPMPEAAVGGFLAERSGAVRVADVGT